MIDKNVVMIKTIKRRMENDYKERNKEKNKEIR